MENTNWDQRRDDELAQHSAHDAAPQNDWQNAESKASPNYTAEEFISEDASRNTTEDDEHVHAMAGLDDPDEDEEADTEETEEETAGDWGHIDPAESNSPFPDSNEPSAPGSAV